MSDKGEGITEIDSHISKKYEIRRRIGKGVSTKIWRKLKNVFVYPEAAVPLSAWREGQKVYTAVKIGDIFDMV